jgi:hypothetical protein
MMVATIPENPDTLLRRAQTAEALTEAGFPTSPATLATLATRGGGPPYQLYGRVPVYRWGNSLAWAEGRLSRLVHSTAEAEVAGEHRYAESLKAEIGPGQKKVMANADCATSNTSLGSTSNRSQPT